MYRIYAIECAINGKLYVGYTAHSIAKRFQEHINRINCSSCQNALTRAMKKHGRQNFSITEIACCKTHADACATERDVIAANNCILPHGYNMTTGGDGVPMLPDARERANEKMRAYCGDKRTPKQLDQDKRKKAKKQTPEHVEKCRKMKIGKRHSEEWKKNISLGLSNGKYRPKWSASARASHRAADQRKIDKANANQLGFDL